MHILGPGSLLSLMHLQKSVNVHEKQSNAIQVNKKALKKQRQSMEEELLGIIRNTRITYNYLE